MSRCSILSCCARKSRNQRNLTFHRLPKNEVLRRKWLNAIGLENINPKHQSLLICSLHFEEAQFNRTLDVVRLCENAVPTLFNTEPYNVDFTENNFLKEDVLLCCRGCLATDRKLFNIYDHNLANAFVRITGTPVYRGDRLQHLCSYCCRLLLKCQSFRDMCLHTQCSLTAELRNGMVNLDHVRKINRPFNHYIDLNVCEVDTVQYIDLDNPLDCEYLDDNFEEELDYDFEEEMETVEGIDGVINDDIEKELETAVGTHGIINEDIEEVPKIIILDIDGIINNDIEDEPATVPGTNVSVYNGIEEKLETIAGTDGITDYAIEGKPETKTVGLNINKTDTTADFETKKGLLNTSADVDGIGNNDTGDETGRVPGTYVILYNDIKEKLETIVGTDGIIDDVIDGKPKIQSEGWNINKTDTEADFEIQKLLLNISADKLKHVKNRARKIGNALNKMKKKEMADTNVNDERNDVKLTAEQKIRMLLKMKRAGMKITDCDITSENDDEPTELEKVGKMRKENIRSMRKADNDYMPDYDFAEFETANDVEIVILTKEEQLAEIEARKASEEYKMAAYACEVCGKYYRTEDLYNTHIEKHSEKEGPNECPVCKMRFKWRSKYWEHYDKHRFKFVCKQCGFVSRVRAQARLHHQYHDGKKYECSYCPKVFSKYATHLGHVRLAHKTLNTVCGMCGETFVDVHKHMALVHGVAPARKKARMKCKICEVTFISTHALNKHKMAAGEEHTKMFPCVQCGDTFDSVDAMKIHDDKEHPKCEDCNVTFLNAACFDTHVDRKHRGVGDPVTKKQKEANMRAKELGRPLPYPGNHSYGEPRIAVCDHCGKIFKNRSLLEYHLRKLRGEKLKHACPLCPKSFYIRDSYEDHLRVHTGEKPFQCDHCGMAFGAKGNLHRHVQTVHLGTNKKFACDICGRVFSAAYSVKLHVRTVHNGEPWPRRVRKKSKVASESTD